MVDDAGGSRARAAGLALGIAFLAVGILGFILNPTEGALLGVFAVNAVHNLVHVLFGILGLAAAYAGWSRPYCQGVGAIYLLLGVLGFVPGLYGGNGMLLGLVHTNPADNLLHLVLGGIAAYFGFASQRSRPEHIACPVCRYGKLRLWSSELGGWYGTLQLWSLDVAECDSCGRAFDDAVLKTLEQIVALPEVLGKHACECGYPEMRRLPDGTYHCPACGAEVLPIESISGVSSGREGGPEVDKERGDSRRTAPESRVKRGGKEYS